MALCMEAFTDTLPIVCNGFKEQYNVSLQPFHELSFVSYKSCVFPVISWSDTQNWTSSDTHNLLRKNT